MVTVNEIRMKEFSAVENGYSPDEVDDFLDALADQTEALVKENRELSAKIKETEENNAGAEKLVDDEQAYLKNMETTLRETLISAQRIADQTVAEARKKAQQMISEAEEQSTAMLDSAKAEVESAKAESEKLQKATAEYRAHFQKLVEEQMNILKADAATLE